MNPIKADTVSLDEETKELVLIDQTQLPGELVLLRLSGAEEIHRAIATLQVRGAPAIGVAAALGLYVILERRPAKTTPEFLDTFRQTKAYLASSRPTAVNLFWALERMEQAALAHPGGSVEEIRERLRQEALAIYREDIETCRRLGEHGLSLLQDGDGILTHCNAGRLAAVRYGTALAPIYVGTERGMKFHVYCDETRPLLQGARLSAFELAHAGVETTLLCDNMASSAMQQGGIQAVIVGADRIAANGDTANKIGTSGVAILAKQYGIPFYVAAPSSTFDQACPHGGEIPIEQRSSEEVTEMWYQKRMAPEGIHIYNPAFDVTPHGLITAFITEKGILRPDYKAAIRRMKED